jgi:hypothetical protein
MTEAIQNQINQYLEDTIAAERNFESALSSFGKAGVQPEIQQLLSSFSAKAKTQHERLTAVLESRGGSPSAAKTVLAEMLAFTPLSAQISQVPPKKIRNILWSPLLQHRQRWRCTNLWLPPQLKQVMRRLFLLGANFRPKNMMIMSRRGLF